MILNYAQIIYIVVVIGFFGFIYGRKIVKDHNKRQKERNYWKHR